jgi:hypothetical protein
MALKAVNCIRSLNPGRAPELRRCSIGALNTGYALAEPWFNSAYLIGN